MSIFSVFLKKISVTAVLSFYNKKSKSIFFKYKFFKRYNSKLFKSTIGEFNYYRIVMLYPSFLKSWLL